MLFNKLHHLALNGSKFRTSRLATQMVAAMAALSISYGASAGALYNKADKTDPINLNIAGQVVAEGDVYMDNHTWFDATDSLVIKGSLLSVTDPTGTPCLQLNSGKKAGYIKTLERIRLGWTREQPWPSAAKLMSIY